MEALIEKSKSKKNAARFLYEQDLRTPLFQLEGLSRMYASSYDTKFFKKLKKRAKALEDALGKIDYYDAFEKMLRPVNEIPTEIKLYLIHRVSNSIDEFHDLLLNDKWLSGKRISKIYDKLNDTPWKESSEELPLLHAFFEQEIKDLDTFWNDLQDDFHDAEHDLHEIRRKIRWLSIYAQALQGSVQLKKNKSIPPALKKYATKEIIQSPYNSLPAATKTQQVIYFSQTEFYALSWMIQNLGRIKDACLLSVVLQEASNATGIILNTDTLRKKTKLMLQPISSYLHDAQKQFQVFMKEQVLHHLLLPIQELKS